MKIILEKIIKFCIYLLVFLLPLFWLPFSFEAIEFNKQYLLFFLTSLAFVSWLAKMVVAEGTIKFRKTPLDIFAGLFLTVAILSAIFSVDKNSSVFGFYGRFSDSLIGLLSLGALYFLITNNVAVKAENPKAEKNSKLKIPNSSLGICVPDLVKVFLGSVSLVVLTAYFSIFGVWERFSFLPQAMRQKVFNPISGSLEGLAVFLSVIMVFLAVKVSLGKKNKKLSIAPLLLLLSIAGLLLIVDYNASWLVLLLSLVIFLGFSLWKRVFKENANNLFLPLILLGIAVFGLSVDLSLVKGLVREQVLDRGLSWQVGLAGATDSVKSVFLGSGIGTFHYDFTKEKPQSFNQDRLWQFRFDRPGSYFSEILGTMGFLGILSYLALIGSFLLISWFLLRAKFSNFQLVFFMAFLALVIAQFAYYQNTALAFAFWLFLALGAVSWEKGATEKTFSLKKIPELGLVSNAVLGIIGLGLLASFYFGGRIYWADKNFALAQPLAGGLAKTNILEKTVEFNPGNSQYWTILAKSYFREAQQELQKSVELADKDYLQNRIALAIDAAKQASTHGPGQVAALENLAMIYRDIRVFIGGAQDWAVKYFREAIALEPTNPVLRTELAKILEDPDQAEQELATAVALKPDYLDALLQQAFFEERLGNIDGAIDKMQKLSLRFPANVEVLYQLGLAYFNAQRVDESISQLEKVLILVPNHSNSLYALGTAWQKKGDKARARDYFEMVLELNPDNADVKNKLKEVK